MNQRNEPVKADPVKPLTPEHKKLVGKHLALIVVYTMGYVEPLNSDAIKDIAKHFLEYLDEYSGNAHDGG